VTPPLEAARAGALLSGPTETPRKSACWQARQFPPEQRALAAAQATCRIIRSAGTNDNPKKR
jgi:hypothetical protein